MLYRIILLIITLGLMVLPAAAALPTPLQFHTPSAPQADDPSPPAEPVKLVFIHHSCGGNWLADGDGGLGLELMNNNYFVSATNYGWEAGGDTIGDRTDIGHWWEWFRGPSSAAYLSALYAESDQNFGGFGSWSRLPTDPGGENEIIMFKSCYPNSNLGGSLGNPIPPIGSNPLRGEAWDSGYHTVPNAQGIYLDLLECFATRQDKLFIAVTAPARVYDITSTEAANARDFNNWLVNDWLNGYAHNNVAVFDFFNVLTSNGGDPDTNDVGEATGNHHRWWSNAVQHIQTEANNFGAYGDDHPNSAGNQKATAEFVPLLNVYYNRWQGGAAPAPSLTLTAPNGGESWTVGNQRPIQWTSSGDIANVSLAYSTDNFGASHEIASSTANDGSYDWTIPDDPSASVRVRVASVVSPTTVYDDSDADFTISEAGGGSYTFNAIIAPSNATQPVTYLWSPEPASGQGTAIATYQWASGTHVVSVEVTNCGGTFNDTYTYTVGAAQTMAPRHTTAQTMAFQDGVWPDASYAGTIDVILASDADDNANLGGTENLETYFGDSVEVRRSLMRWDISTLPSEITIDNATVELYRYNEAQAVPTQLELYRVTSNWVEGTGYDLNPGSGYVPDGATWLTATATIPWTSPGGDYDSTILDQMTIPAGMASGWIRLDATDAVLDWVSGSEPNYGLLLRPDSGDWTVHYFHSREGSTPTLRPRLVVTYTSGAPAPELTLTIPTGSTSWPVNSAQQIQWDTSGTVAQVNLYYSLGGSFTLIESAVANTGVYPWTTPPTPSASAQVRVESVISPTTVHDVSDYFTLYDTTVSTGTIYLPLITRNYGSCAHPLTGVSISGPASGALVQPSDLTYLGAFRLPDMTPGTPATLTWEYSGQALTYRPDGDPGGGGDGYPGSLFGAGHDVVNYISEISIPAPSLSRDLAQLNVATTIQSFKDVRAGLFGGLEEMPRVGMQYLPAQAGQTSAKLHLSWGAHHQDEGALSHIPSHAWCDVALSNPNTAGAWWVGDDSTYRLYASNGYIFEIPAEWANAHLEGVRLATGRYRDGGWSGMGPNVFAYGPWLDGSPPAAGAILTAHTLLSYSFAGGDYALNNYHDSDEWEGGAWVTAGEKTAVVFVGAKGGGDYWWYGYSSPAGDGMPCPHIPEPGQKVRCYNSSDGSDCAPELLDCAGYTPDSKGWWSSRFDAQMIFYDPADFIAVLGGAMEPYEPQPYATLDIDERLFVGWPGETEVDCGTGDQRKCRIGAMAYDRERGFLYVLERFADESKPLVHVWMVNG